jgi:hypothetical protein
VINQPSVVGLGDRDDDANRAAIQVKFAAAQPGQLAEAQAGERGKAVPLRGTAARRQRRAWPWGGPPTARRATCQQSTQINTVYS